jgi:hypothetical protein
MENLERFGVRNDVVNRSAIGHDENLRRNLQFGERTTIRVSVKTGLEPAPYRDPVFSPFIGVRLL